MKFIRRLLDTRCMAALFGLVLATVGPAQAQLTEAQKQVVELQGRLEKATAEIAQLKAPPARK